MVDFGADRIVGFGVVCTVAVVIDFVGLFCY